jgi:hypothetical protein
MYLYGLYCPVARASEILADRWTPLINARAFPLWFARSPMADAVRAALPGRATVAASG